MRTPLNFFAAFFAAGFFTANQAVCRVIGSGLDASVTAERWCGSAESNVGLTAAFGGHLLGRRGHLVLSEQMPRHGRVRRRGR